MKSSFAVAPPTLRAAFRLLPPALPRCILSAASSRMTTEATKTEVGSYFIANYPPFSQWTTGAGRCSAGSMAIAAGDVPLGLYLHIPFCRKRCKFCYFRVYTDKNSHEVEQYVAALCARSSWSAGCR